MDKKELEKLTLEETFENVDDIMEKLSQDDLPLEESFNLYKEGMELLKHCSGVIDKVEKQIITLSEQSDAEE